MKYRSEIDGLRAIAVIPVILFHAGFDLFSGGFIGVDIFFVISGYLITTIIHSEIQSQNFSIIQFYERRARRILPALFFVSLVCIPFAWLWMMPGEYKDFSQSIIAVNVFSSNILFWLESDYFARAAELKPLLHTWSLAVEEQFYVFFPLLLLLFRRYRDNSLLILLLVIVSLSLGASEYFSRNYPSANFYLLPTRAWELGIGAILALKISKWRYVNSSIAQILSYLGFVLVIYSIFYFDKTVRMPSISGLIPVIGTALIIIYANNETIVGKILSLKPVVGIGLISYSAYLWHQPLFAFAKIRLLDEEQSSGVYIGLSACSLLLAYYTWRYVEAPFRNKKKFKRAQIFSGALSLSIIFIGFGLVGHFKSGIPERLPNAVKAYSDYSKDVPTRLNDCLIEPDSIIKLPLKKCIYNSKLKLKTAIWGDSHAAAIVDGLADNFLIQNEGLVQLTYQACPPVIGYKNSDMRIQCNHYNIEAFDYIKNSNIETVILLARWTLYLEGERFNNQEGGVESGGDVYGLPMDKNYDYIYSKKRISAVGLLYRSTVEKLLKAGKRVVLIYPIPEVGWDVPTYLAKKTLRGSEEKEDLSTSFDVFQHRSHNAYKQLDILDSHPNLLRIYPEKIVCNSVISGRCIVQLDGKPLYYDDDHFNSIASNMLSKVILTSMQGSGWFE